MKIQMESPGSLRLTGKSFTILLLLGLFTVSLSGGGVHFKHENGNTEFSIQTQGLLKAIGDYLDKDADRELTNSAIRAVDSMKISSPKDIEVPEMLLEKRNEAREKN